MESEETKEIQSGVCESDEGKMKRMCFFFFKQKTAYEIKECDWSSDVCSSDLLSFERKRTSRIYG